jgi:putative transposase
VAQTCGNIVVHIIFSTKQRKLSITPEIRSDLFAYLDGIVRKMRRRRSSSTVCRIMFICWCVFVPRIPSRRLHELLRQIRRVGCVRGRDNFARQAGYGVFSVSESGISAVTRYIATREEHHKKHSFQEEFVELLKKNNVAHDERYIWD